jgi:ferrochelatase
MTRAKAGIALMNMGSPASPADVPRFLRQLFLDIEMFDFPGERFIRPVFATLISNLRADRVRRRYRVLGGTSPLLPLTQQQAVGLEGALRKRGYEVPVEVCMRYSHPFAADGVERLRMKGVGEIIGLPLYPQFSHSTSGSSLIALRKAVDSLGVGMPVREIPHWCDDPDYHAALARRILAARGRLADDHGVGLLFVAHSVPERFVLKGDPYVEQVETTVAGILDVLEREGSERLPWLLAYQSQVGPIRWVGPTVTQALEAMLGDGLRSVVVTPVSFVSDHLETLYDIDLQYRRKAFELGFERFERTDSLNASEDFVDLLAGLVVHAHSERLSRTGDEEDAGSEEAAQ